MAAKLDALSGPVFVAVHHEPANDGTAADWSAMQVHPLPILGRGANVAVGVIGNGWWWSAKAKGYSDAEIAKWITPSVRNVSAVIGADTYDGGGEDAGVKIRRMSAWASRVGVSRLGIGEFNGQSAAAITHATDAAKADPRFVWACVWNSNQGIVTVLTGAPGGLPSRAAVRHWRCPVELPYRAKRRSRLRGRGTAATLGVGGSLQPSRRAEPLNSPWGESRAVEASRADMG